MKEKIVGYLMMVCCAGFAFCLMKKGKKYRKNLCTGDDIMRLRRIISHKRTELFERYQGNCNLCSREYVSIHFADELEQDLCFLENIAHYKYFEIRHAAAIIRDLCEQVIQYKYLMRHEELISEYLGTGIDLGTVEEEINLVFALRKFGQGRYNKKRSVRDMAKEINEDWSEDSGEHLTLYGIYIILSESMHNSYYEALLHHVGQIQSDEDDNTDVDDLDLYLLIIVTCFFETFKTV